jgi:hypothetical protein
LPNDPLVDLDVCEFQSVLFRTVPDEEDLGQRVDDLAR